MLFSKQEKTNMGKYQQFVRTGKKSLPLFALKGLLYRYACHVLGVKYKLADAKPAPAVAALGAAADAPMPVVAAAAAIDRPTLKQQAVTTADVSPIVENQLQKAAGIYSDMTRYHKHNLIVSVMHATMVFHSEQNKQLRSCTGGAEWELRMLKGAIHDHTRLTMYTTQALKYYNDFGIELGWRPVDAICINHPRVKFSDDQAAMLWDLCFAVTRGHVGRNLVFTHGYPKRFALLTDDSTRDAALALLKKDRLFDELVQTMEDDWARKFNRRSVFQRLTVKQVVLCIDVEGGLCTERYRHLWTQRGLSLRSR
jgi:hypothetical protein